MRFLACLLLSLLVGIGASVWAIPGDRPLDVYKQWRGDGCRYDAPRPYFFIKDLYELDRFWRALDTDEAMPHIDFSSLMLFAWVPGSTLFDYIPVRVAEFLIEQGRFIIVLELERKDSGGFWRRPYLLTLLPRVRQGDVFIMRAGRPHLGERRWIPMYTIYDMDTIRTETVAVTAATLFEPKPTKQPAAQVPGKQPSGASSIPLDGSMGEEPTTTIAAVPSTPAPARSSAKPQAKPATSPDDDLFGDMATDFSPSGTPNTPSLQAKTETKPPAKRENAGTSKPANVTASTEPGAAYPPGDPFGSDFDLEF